MPPTVSDRPEPSSNMKATVLHREGAVPPGIMVGHVSSVQLDLSLPQKNGKFEDKESIS